MIEMKKVWSRPLTVVQNFEANEYVAACGDKGTVYKFKCDANSGGFFFNGGHVFLENGLEGGLQLYGENKDQELGSYHRCSETHEASTQDDFLHGYLTTYAYTNAQEVIIWRGEDGQNIHCTTVLNKDDWETSKS